ncbi:MAG: hypothetical protein NTW19_12740 [Planctomycetota bacterium]|nr:hypothetical protein [Planctomycetota bacterium]
MLNAKRRRAAISGCLMAAMLCATAPAMAQTAPAKPAATKPAAADITVAVIDFEGKDPANPDLGKNITEVLTAVLGAEDGFKLVERAQLEKKLHEHAINLTGVVDPDQAVKIGKLIGARILITGKCFMVGQQTFITAKVIGVETGLVKPVLVKAPSRDAKLDELIVQLGTDVAATLHKHGESLLPKDTMVDPVPGLVEALAKRKLPRVAVIIPETHMSAPPAVDPAAETEIKVLLHKAGIEIQDVDQNDLASWAKSMDRNDINAWPKSLANVDLVITGKGFSELGARIGSLVSCSARVEVNVISRKDGKVVLPDRTTSRDVDLSENIAAKKALQKAGRTIGVDILTFFVKTLPPAEAAKIPTPAPQ